MAGELAGGGSGLAFLGGRNTPDIARIVDAGDKVAEPVGHSHEAVKYHRSSGNNFRKGVSPLARASLSRRPSSPPWPSRSPQDPQRKTPNETARCQPCDLHASISLHALVPARLGRTPTLTATRVPNHIPEYTLPKLPLPSRCDTVSPSTLSAQLLLEVESEEGERAVPAEALRGTRRRGGEARGVFRGQQRGGYRVAGPGGSVGGRCCRLAMAVGQAWESEGWRSVQGWIGGRMGATRTLRKGGRVLWVAAAVPAGAQRGADGAGPGKTSRQTRIQTT